MLLWGGVNVMLLLMVQVLVLQVVGVGGWQELPAAVIRVRNITIAIVVGWR